MVAIAVAVTNLKPSVSLPPQPPYSRHPRIPNSISCSHRLALHSISAPHALTLLPPSALAPCNIHGTTDYPTTQTCTHLYKTMGSPLLGKSEGAGSLVRFFIYGYETTAYIIPISTIFALGFWDVYMGSLVKIVFWSTTACIRTSQHPQEHVFSFEFSSTSLTHPHTSLPSICLHLSLRLLSPILLPFRPASFSCGSNSLYLCYAVRAPSPLRSLSLYHSPHKPVSQTRCHSLFIVHSSCFVFFPAFACFPEKFASPLSEPFSDSDSLNFDASSQGVGEKWKIEIWKRLKFNEIASSSMPLLLGGSAWALAGICRGFYLERQSPADWGFQVSKPNTEIYPAEPAPSSKGAAMFSLRSNTGKAFPRALGSYSDVTFALGPRGPAMPRIGPSMNARGRQTPPPFSVSSLYWGLQTHKEVRG